MDEFHPIITVTANRGTTRYVIIRTTENLWRVRCTHESLDATTSTTYPSGFDLATRTDAIACAFDDARAFLEGRWPVPLT